MNGNGENGGKSEEKQKLLVVTDEVVEMNRVSSARFQVSKTNDEENGEKMVRKLKSGSEPPPPVAQEHVTMVTRKMSATGRFMVTSDTNPGQLVAEIANELDVITPLEAPERSPASRAKGVHFSVGDKDSGSISDETEDRKKEKDHSHENQTTFNMKSWRNMRTIEHPPIIDFYRNSIDTDAVFNRPSMAQLIHGKQHNEEDLGFEELNSALSPSSDTELSEIRSSVGMSNLVSEEIAQIDRETSRLMVEEAFHRRTLRKLKRDRNILLAQHHHLEDSPVHEKTKSNEYRMEKMNAPPTSSQKSRVKFGWIQGVFVRCLLNIFGVMLYLRVSWVSGQAGVGLGSCIVLLASLVTTITALSTCAICTNGDVKGGGAYFLISRSLGPEFGGSIGIIFSIANAVGAAMYIVGFAESFRDVLIDYNIGTIWDGGLWDVRVIGFVTCVLLMGIVFIGSEFESKMQLGLLVILLGSIANYIFGSFFTPSELAINRGATGYSFDTLQSNFLPHFTDNNTFFSVFSVYFPAATGIMAGANISGDLANPQRAIPLGTLLAILVTTIVYLATVWMTGSTVVAFSNGTEPALFNNSVFIPPDCAPDCPFGLVSYYQVVEMSSFWGPLITAGIFAATLSSALASLVSAPKVFQAVCKDRLFPRIDYFAKTYGKNEEPKRAYVLGFFLALGIVAIGDLNVIAPIISNFFLGSYALINYACFDQSFADSPGFRPGFTYYNMWISLIGAILCVFVMFIIDWFSALVTFFCFGAIFMYLLHRKPDVNWGSSTQAHSYKNALSAMIKLSTTEEHVKNYRPQVLVLSGNPASRSCLVDFANNITKGSSLLVCGQVVPYDPSDRVHTVIRKLDDVVSIWMRKRHLKAFYRAVANSSFRKGAQSLIQLTGIAKMKPNIVLVGFKSNWYMGGPTEQNLNEMNEYFGTIQDVFDWNMAVCVLRNGGVGLDFSEAMRNLNLVEPSSKINVPNIENQEKVEKSTNGNLSPETVHLIEKDETARTEKSADDASSSISINETYGSEENPDDDDHDHDDDDDDVGDSGADDDDERPNKDDDVELGVMDHQDTEKRHFSLRRRGSRRHTVEQKALLSSIQRFQRKIKKGVIDVWWLYDDGGLTLLIPHLLSIPKSYLEGARLRIFTISTSSRTMEQEQRGMAALLSKFRIDYSDVYVIADIGKKPRQETMATWQSVIDPFTAPDGSCPMGMTTKSELSAQRDKTYRQLRAGELLQEHSIKADLIVMTLPVPRKGMVSSSLYLSWLEVMTRNLPPILLVRGNQQSVLTFYS